LRRIEQLQRGISTPSRRKPLIGGSKNTSPYSRNSSNSKNRGTPTNNNNTKPSYLRNNSNGRNNTYQQKVSPNRFGVGGT
jgi:hypothetical protein